MSESNNIILFGVPRSGTTWLSEVLTFNNGIQNVHEPDNELNSFLGLIYKQGLSRFPYFSEGREFSRINQFYQILLTRDVYGQGSLRNELMYKIYGLKKNQLKRNLEKEGTALTKGLPLSGPVSRFLIKGESKQRKLIKTVHSLLLLPYLTKRLRFLPVVIFRNPLNVFSSYMAMGLPDRDRKLYNDKLLLKDFGIDKPAGIEQKDENYRSGFQLGVFQKVIQSYMQTPALKHVIFVDYEQMIANPFEEIEGLCRRLKIDFTGEMEQFMKRKFTKGEGYQTNRDIRGHAEVWRKRLEADQVERFLAGFNEVTRLTID